MHLLHQEYVLICQSRTFTMGFKKLFFLLTKAIFHQKMKSCSKCTHPQVIQDVDVFVSSSDLEKCYITCSAMDALQ